MKHNIHLLLIVYTGFFLFFFLYYGLIGYKEVVPTYAISLQIYYAVTYLLCVCITLKIKNLNKLLVLVFLYSLFSAIIIRWISLEFLGTPFFGAVDSVSYDGYATYAVNHDMSIFSFLDSIADEGYNYDDYGMFLIVFNTYNLIGDVQVGQWVLLLLNALVITGYTKKLYQTMNLFDVRRPVKNFCLMSFACLPFLSLTAAVGLKENFFVFVIIYSFHYMYRYNQTRKMNHLFLCILWMSFSLFFRTAIFAIILISFIVLRISKEKNRKVMLFILLFIPVIGYLSIGYLIQLLYGIDLSSVLVTTNYRLQTMNKLGNGAMWYVQSLAIFFGPFPNFSRLVTYGIVHSSGLVMKGLLGYFVLTGTIDIIKKMDYKSYSILFYFLGSFILLVVGGVALDLRYQITLIPIIIPMIAKSLQKKTSPKYFLFYSALLFMLILNYNNR